MTERDDDRDGLDQRVNQLLKAVGTRFAQTRAEMNVKPGTLADLANLSRDNLRRLELTGNVTLRTLLRATLALGMHPADLFEDRVLASPPVVREITTALARLLAALPPDVRQAVDERTADENTDQHELPQLRLCACWRWPAGTQHLISPTYRSERRRRPD